MNGITKEEKILLSKLYKVHLKKALKAGGIILAATCFVDYSIIHTSLVHNPWHEYATDFVAAVMAGWMMLRWEWNLREKELALTKWRNAVLLQRGQIQQALDVMQHTIDDPQGYETNMDRQAAKLTLRRQVREIRSVIGTGPSVLESAPPMQGQPTEAHARC